MTNLPKMLNFTAINFDTYLKFVFLDENVQYLAAKIAAYMEKIEKYNKSLELLINENRDFVYLYEDFTECVEEFREVTSDLETNLEEYFKAEKELELPTNFAYKKLLKTIKDYPIPSLKKL